MDDRVIQQPGGWGASRRKFFRRLIMLATQEFGGVHRCFSKVASKAMHRTSIMVAVMNSSHLQKRSPPPGETNPDALGVH